jgi:hypothetical protein
MGHRRYVGLFAVTSFVLAGCELVLGLGPTKVEGNEGGADAPSDTTSDFGDRRAVSSDARSDAPGRGSFCKTLEAAHLFCDDFDTDLDGGPAAAFDEGGSVLGPDSALALSDAEFVSAPRSLSSTVGGPDVVVPPANVAALAVQNLSSPTGALPRFIDFDMRLASAGCADHPGSLQFLDLEIGRFSFTAHASFIFQYNAFSLVPVAFGPPVGVYAPSGVFPDGAVPLDAWLHFHLDIARPVGAEPEDSGAGYLEVAFVDVHLSAQNLDTDAGATISATVKVPIGLDASKPYDSHYLTVRLGLAGLSHEILSCTAYYDNLVIGPYADGD